MQQLLRNLQITVNEGIYIKNPEQTELGRNIIKGGIELIEQMGLEQFTFKKLSEHIQTTESSIYRYFENKHKLLLYLVNWYWAWMEYHLVFSTNNVFNAEERLLITIKLFTKNIVEDGAFEHINEVKLHKIVTSESYKAYLTKEIDKENVEGFYAAYKRIVNRISSTIAEINPNFQYPHTLATTFLEGSSLQKYFTVHFPTLTDIQKNNEQIGDFFIDLLFGIIKTSGK